MVAPRGKTRLRLELLAAALAKGKTVEAAMLDAMYAPSTARLGLIRCGDKRITPWDHPAVAALIAETRARVRKGSEVTTATISAALADAYELAKQQRNPGAMIAASMARARLLGLFVDRKADLHMKALDEMTPPEIERWLALNGMDAELAEFRASQHPASEGRKPERQAIASNDGQAITLPRRRAGVAMARLGVRGRPRNASQRDFPLPASLPPSRTRIPHPAPGAGSRRGG